MGEDQRVFLTYEQAEEMLPEGDHVHVVSNPSGGLMIGADWPRGDVLEAFRSGQPQLAGPMAAGAGHGIAMIHDGRRLFFKTRPEAAGEAR